MTDLRATLIATAKNEAPYYLEWVAHHLEVGFTDIVIYQNDSDDLTHETLRCLADIGAIQYFYNRAKTGSHQVRAYQRAAALPAFRNADWVMALDLDEFLLIKSGKDKGRANTGGRLADLLTKLPDSDCIHLNWRIFGSSGHEALTSHLVTERFERANYQLGEAESFGAYKCLFRPTAFNRAGIHRPNGPLIPEETIRCTNGSGLRPGNHPTGYQLKNYNSTDPKGCLHAQINHYITRDLASFMLKSARGSAHQSNRAIGRRYWNQRNKNHVPDIHMRAYAPRIRARMAALDRASDGRLMELRRTAIFTHLAQFYSLLQKARHRTLYDHCRNNRLLPEVAHLVSAA